MKDYKKEAIEQIEAEDWEIPTGLKRYNADGSVSYKSMYNAMSDFAALKVKEALEGCIIDDKGILQMSLGMGNIDYELARPEGLQEYRKIIKSKLEQ